MAEYTLKYINHRAECDAEAFVHDCEEGYHRQLHLVADQIAANCKRKPVVLLNGPSSSGKTTTNDRLGRSLELAGNHAKVSKTLGTTLRMTVIITLPAGAGFIMLAGPILRMLYSQGTELGGVLMGLLGFAVPAAALVAVTNSTLQAFGRIDLPLVSMFAGAVVKMLGDYFLIGNPALNIMGAPISTALCYWLIAVINLFHIRRLTGSLPPIGKTVCRPLAATIGMSAAIFIVQRVLNGALSAAPGTMPDKLITLACIGVAVAVYAVLLLALGAVERDDVLLLPKGEKIADILHLQ